MRDLPTHPEGDQDSCNNNEPKGLDALGQALKKQGVTTALIRQHEDIDKKHIQKKLYQSLGHNGRRADLRVSTDGRRKGNDFPKAAECLFAGN